MAKLHERFSQLVAHPLSAPLALLGLSLVSYGLYLGWMGFYWDDWPIAWTSHISDSYGIRFFQFQRPLSGWVVSLAAFVIDEVPLRWQMLTLGLRYTSGLALWWLMRAIWPRYRNGALAIAALFLVFPGFSQQFVSVNSAPHLVALILFTLSLVFMVLAEQRKPPSWPLRLLSIVTAFVSMMTTDYYYGLELIRPLVIWLSWEREERTLRKLVRASLPYLVLLLAMFLWRSYISQYGAYSLSLLGNLRAAPLATIKNLVSTMLADLATATWGVWVSVFELPNRDQFDNLVTAYFWAIVLASALGFGVFLLSPPRGEDRRSRGWEILLLGTAALVFGGISFWVPGLPFRTAFPADRLMLPMMLGSALVLTGSIELVVRPRRAQAILFSAFIALSVGAHFFNALSYRVDWENQQEFYTQLIWRIPGLAPGTTLISDELPFEYVTDNSITGAINWIYAPDFSAPRDYYDWEYRIDPFISLPYMLRYLDLRLGWQLPRLEEAADYEAPYRFFHFRGSSEDVVLVHYRPGYCLRVFDPNFDEGDPRLTELSALADYALPFSNQALILPNPEEAARLPEDIFGRELPPSWCYYFEKADLARQQGNWQEVVRLGDLARQEGIPRDSIPEAVVFIEGYAMVGDWLTASEISKLSSEANPAVTPMLCATWTRVAASTTEEVVRAAAGEQLVQLGCH